MISKETYGVDWIQRLSAKLGKRGDPKILEKVIYAFLLLEQLRANGLNLIFKGGTSLLLATEKPRRFSIDIDIITEHTPTEIETVLTNITNSGLFLDWEEDKGRKHNEEAPFVHYKIYYNSLIDKHFGDEPILLDVLLASNPYPNLREVDIHHEWLLKHKEPQTVFIPTLEAILGDKLTAFAPNTTGILYTKNRPVEIIKQLYDIGFLFDLVENVQHVRDTYDKVVTEEIRYRKLKIEKAEVLQDTFQTCKLLSLRIPSMEYDHLQTGINRITNHILGHFKIDEAIKAASKVAYLTSLLSAKGNGVIEKFQNMPQVQSIEITNTQYNKLNKLKKSNVLQQK